MSAKYFQTIRTVIKVLFSGGSRPLGESSFWIVESTSKVTQLQNVDFWVSGAIR